MRRRLPKVLRNALKKKGEYTQGWRQCVRCGANFRPAITVSGQSTEFHCSSECAIAAFLKKGEK